jgi:hypothetical protein
VSFLKPEYLEGAAEGEEDDRGREECSQIEVQLSYPFHRCLDLSFINGASFLLNKKARRARRSAAI